MCKCTIEVDNDKVRRINPHLTDRDSINRWLQHYVDEFIDNFPKNGHIAVSPNAHSAAEMREILQERIRRAEAGEEKLISNTDVFAQIDKRYGF